MALAALAPDVRHTLLSLPAKGFRQVMHLLQGRAYPFQELSLRDRAQ